MSRAIPGPVLAVVPAAGIGARMNAEIPKQYLKLADKTILEHSLDRLLAVPAITQIVVALHSGDRYWEQLPCSRNARIVTVTGGAERSDSVLAALGYLAAAGRQDDWVLVHDAARPCVPVADIEQLLDSRDRFPDGAILAAPITDTVKRGDDQCRVETTVPRESLFRALTPQLFPRLALQEALAACQRQGISVTDEASALEHSGQRPGLVMGSSANIKVTRPEDLPLCLHFLAGGEAG